MSDSPGVQSPTPETETLADERGAMAQVIANSFYAMQAGEFPDPALQPEPNAGDLQLASDLQEAGFSRSPASLPVIEAAPDDPRRLIYEVRMMLSSVASHGPHALTTTDDPMYTARLLQRLSRALEASQEAGR